VPYHGHYSIERPDRMHSISVNWCFNIAKVTCADILEFGVEFAGKLIAQIGGRHNLAWLSDSEKPGGDIYVPTIDIGIAMMNDVAEIESNSDLQAPFSRYTEVLCLDRLQDGECGEDSVTRFVEFDKRSISERLYEATVISRDDFLLEVVNKPQPGSQRALFVSLDKTDGVGNVNKKDRLARPFELVKRCTLWLAEQSLGHLKPGHGSQPPHQPIHYRIPSVFSTYFYE
jgi:hypothetical protein